jgi:hypothetical protein
MVFHWSGQGGQPSWLWGSNDGVNNYVYNPSNFSVSYASTIGITYNDAANSTYQMLWGSGNSVYGNSNIYCNPYAGSVYANFYYGTAQYAEYADLAEKYLPDSEYEPGTVVVFGGDEEITTTTEFADSAVAGVISTDPAFLMNQKLDGGLPLALRGRVPVKVTGPVNKGDSLVTSTVPGYAQSVGKDKTYGQAVFAKAIVTDLSEGEKVIEAVIL